MVRAPSNAKRHDVLKALLPGKVFYIDLEGPGKVPVLHFGMTGMLRVRDSMASYLRSINGWVK